jgi:hypothetical protein
MSRVASTHERFDLLRELLLDLEVPGRLGHIDHPQLAGNRKAGKRTRQLCQLVSVRKLQIDHATNVTGTNPTRATVISVLLREITAAITAERAPITVSAMPE